jgi:hypothetical protein
MTKIASDHSPRINAKTLLARCKAEWSGKKLDMGSGVRSVLGERLERRVANFAKARYAQNRPCSKGA